MFQLRCKETTMVYKIVMNMVNFLNTYLFAILFFLVFHFQCSIRFWTKGFQALDKSFDVWFASIRG